MRTELKDLTRALLGFEDRTLKVGEWYELPEEVVIRVSTGRPFAEEKAAAGRDGRRAIVSSESRGPAIRVRPRTKCTDGPHPPHSDCEETCRIDKQGEVLVHIPCTVKSQEMNLRRLSCMEQDEGLVAYLGGLTR